MEGGKAGFVEEVDKDKVSSNSIMTHNVCFLFWVDYSHAFMK